MCVCIAREIASPPTYGNNSNKGSRKGSQDPMLGKTGEIEKKLKNQTRNHSNKNNDRNRKQNKNDKSQKKGWFSFFGSKKSLVCFVLFWLGLVWLSLFLLFCFIFVSFFFVVFCLTHVCV